ncbi:MAG TPA: ester cyclase [Longimicrobiaceae bacterium]|nr:ester cyclase [Longimicrobiaceae bacterium]
MSAQESKATIREYLDAVAADWSEAVNRFVADEALAEHIRFFQQVFPGYTIEVHDLIAEGDKVVLRGTMHGVHRGELMGMPPTGRQVAVPLIIIYRLERGKIVEHWLQADQAGMMQQLTEASTPAAV